MSTNLAGLRTLIASWVDDKNQTYFDAATLNNWILYAQRQVQFELLGAGQNWYVIPKETTTVAGQSDYILPSDFISLQRVEYVQSGTGSQENRIPLTSLTAGQQDLVPIILAPPENYYLKKDRITLFPTPDKAYTLRIYYSPLIVDVANDSDVPDVPNEFIEYVAIVAAFNAYIKDDRAPENLIAKKAEYKEILKKMASQRKQDAARRVVDTQAYDYGAYY